LATAVRNEERKGRGNGFNPIPRLLLACCMALSLVNLAHPAAVGSQTREQCDSCCKQAGYDEYYLEQCKLKCFRNPDHCEGKRVQREPPEPAATEPAPEPTPPKQAEIRLAWPNPLNLVPGKEWEAAAQILAVNGISQQHPYYNDALRDVQAVLMDFARNNPQGGKLPTTQLKRILRQLK